MDLGLKGKIIIVTGGSKGIGSGIVSVLSEEGAIPIIVGRDKDTILSAVNKYRERNYQVGYAFAELTDPMQCERACLLYTSPSPRDGTSSRMPSSA